MAVLRSEVSLGMAQDPKVPVEVLDVASGRGGDQLKFVKAGPGRSGYCEVIMFATWSS